MPYTHVRLNDTVVFGNDLPFVLMAGPCVLQSRDHAFFMVDTLKKLTDDLGIPFVYKTSFDKANRTSGDAQRGLGLEKSLAIFEELRATFAVPIMTDVHDAAQCAVIAPYVDILQIPAFLCRQTDLLLAAGRTGKVINVKKGQFLAPWDTYNIVKKIASVGNSNTLICERGTSFGYNALVNDMRSLPIMGQYGTPVIFDATHSVQQPGGQGTSTGGQREFVPVLARAAVAIGIAGLFIETHNAPDTSPSDGPNMLFLDAMPDLLSLLQELDSIAKENLVVL